jgi:hypothetical protein
VDTQTQTRSSRWFEVQAAGLDSSQRDVLGLLALYGDANISTLTEQHARERREPSYGYGYPKVFHSLEARAWLDLVGHPRVELQDTEQPVEVVRGRVQVLAEARGDALVLKLEPNDLTRLEVGAGLEREANEPALVELMKRRLE